MQGSSFSIPTVTFIGPEKTDSFIKSVSKLGSKGMLVSGSESAYKFGYAEIVATMLGDIGLEVVTEVSTGFRPDFAQIKDILEAAKTTSIDFIVALGGGTTMDAAKAVAVLVAMNEDNIWPYCEGQEKEGRISSALPIVAIPTLSGSGSELSPYAVIKNPDQRRNERIYSSHIRPAVTWLNPTFTVTASPESTRNGAIKTISHIAESYLTDENNNSPLTDHISEGIAKTVIESLPLVLDNPDNYMARSDMLLASSLSLSEIETIGREPSSVNLLNKLANTLNGHYSNVSHGNAIAVLFPLYIKWLSSKPAFAPRIKQFFNKIFSDPKLGLNEGMERFNKWLKDYGIYKSFEDIGVSKGAFPQIATDIITYSDITIGNKNREKLVEEDIISILQLGI